MKVPLNPEQRRALLWMHFHQPVRLMTMTPGRPPWPLLTWLRDMGLIEFDPKMHRADPIIYRVTDEGERALKS